MQSAGLRSRRRCSALRTSSSRPCSWFPPDRSAGSRPAAPSAAPRGGGGVGGKALGYAEDKPPFATDPFCCIRARREVAVAPGTGEVFGPSWGNTWHPSVPLPEAELQKLHYH